MYKLCVFIPSNHLNAVKNAMFEAGAGKIGNYEDCSWQTLGQGQFKPIKNSQPFIGEVNKLETIEEYKVEMVVNDNDISHVIKAMKLAHPYEEPAYDAWSLANI